MPYMSLLEACKEQALQYLQEVYRKTGSPLRLDYELRG